MKIWIDSDALPGQLKDIIIKAANNRKISSVFVSNKNIFLPESNFLQSIKVNQGPDAADNYILEKACSKDLVITQDIPLAAKLVENKITVISYHGDLFSDSNVKERLSFRNFYTELREIGIETSGPKPWSMKNKQKFANTFDSEIVKLLKRG